MIIRKKLICDSEVYSWILLGFLFTFLFSVTQAILCLAWAFSKARLTTYARHTTLCRFLLLVQCKEICASCQLHIDFTFPICCWPGMIHTKNYFYVKLCCFRLTSLCYNISLIWITMQQKSYKYEAKNKS